MKKIIIIYILFIILVGCSTIQNQNGFNDDYPEMKEVVHVYQKTDYTTALNIILNDTGVVVFSINSDKYSCPFCTEVMPILNEVAIQEGWDIIYYVDIYNMRMQNTAEYRLLLGYLDSQTNSLLEKNQLKTLITPDVYFIKDGKIMAHHIATLCNEEGKFIFGLNEEEIKTLKNIYEEYFNLIKDNT